jgi:hypothetical protein
MSILKFELKKEHLQVLKHLAWDEIGDLKSIKTVGDLSPIGGIDHYEDIGLILFGLPENIKLEVDPLDDTGIKFTPEQEKKIDEVLSELPMAIEVILNAQSFELGTYKSKWAVRDWKLIK